MKVSLTLVFLLFCIHSLETKPDTGCCSSRRVGQFSYSLIKDDISREFPEECQERCSYTRDGEDNSPDYCFKPGPLSASCTGNNKEVSCGAHLASSCADCPGQNGEAWCHGDCAWQDGQCKVKLKPVVFSSTGGAAERVYALGEFGLQPSLHNGRPLYKQRDDIGSPEIFLFWDAASWWVGSPPKGFPIALALAVAKGHLKASSTALTPPAEGWKYYNSQSDSWQEDSSLSLSSSPLKPCPRLEVSAIKGSTPWLIASPALGVYTRTNQWSSGRPIYLQEGGGGVLIIKAPYTGWALLPPVVLGPTAWPGLANSWRSISSGRNTNDPSDPKAGPSDRLKNEGWLYSTPRGKWIDSKEEIKIKCL